MKFPMEWKKPMWFRSKKKKEKKMINSVSKTT